MSVASRWRLLTPQFMAAARDQQTLRKAMAEVDSHHSAAVGLLSEIRRQWSAPAALSRSPRCTACLQSKGTTGSIKPFDIDSLMDRMRQQAERLQRPSTPRSRSVDPAASHRSLSSHLTRQLVVEEDQASQVTWERFPQARAGLDQALQKETAQQEAMHKRWAAYDRIRSKVAAWIKVTHHGTTRQGRRATPSLSTPRGRSSSRSSCGSSELFIDRFSECYWNRIWRKSVQSATTVVVRPKITVKKESS